MRCVITDTEIGPDDVFWSDGDLAVSKKAAESMPPDFRKQPFIRFLAFRGRSIPFHNDMSEFLGIGAMTLVCEYRENQLVSVCLSTRPYGDPVPENAVWHCFSNGKYMKSMSATNEFVILTDTRWPAAYLTNEYTKDAVSRLPEQHLKWFADDPTGVWVLTDTGTHAGLSNRTLAGVVKTVEEAEQWCSVGDGHRYHFFKNGQYVKTLEPGFTFNRPTVGVITVGLFVKGICNIMENGKVIGKFDLNGVRVDEPCVNIDGSVFPVGPKKTGIGGVMMLGDVMEMAREGVLKYKYHQLVQRAGTVVNKLLEQGHDVKIVARKP